MEAVETPDGWRLALSVYPPPGRPRGVLWLGHAMMANRSSLDRPRGAGLASRLAQRGFQVVTADLRGHGESRPTPVEGGRYGYDELALVDLPAVTAAVGERWPDLPLAVVGHSLTAHAALAWLGLGHPAGGARVSAVVALAANLWIPAWEPRRARWLAKRAALLAWSRMARRRGYFDARRRGLGSDDVAGPYIEDFLRWARTGRWTTRGGEDLRAALARVTVPVLAVTGRGDRFLCPPRSGRAFAADLTGATVTEWTVGRETGLPYDPGHMQLVTDARSAPLWDDIATWLDSTLPAV